MSHIIRDLEGGVVLVTGASSGIGHAIAVEAARRGAAQVILNFARNTAGAENAAADVRAAGAAVALVQGDVACEEDCRRIAAAAAPAGRLDALFNNAGVTTFAAHSDLDAVQGEDFARIFAVNVTGAFQMVRAARALLECGGGAVVNTASIAGVSGVGSSVPYAASKGALITMTKSLGRALAPRIRVNAICPGFVDTPWFDAPGTDREAHRAAIVARTPLAAASTPGDVAPAAVFLASRAAGHITGETLLIDAGLHLGLRG